MLSIQKLEAYGADTQSGLKRCVNKESLYLRLVGTIPANEGFRSLEDAVAAGDLEAAFQAAHGLKGAVSNLSLTPLSDPISEMTEHLRAHEAIDYSAYLEEIRIQRERLQALCDSDGE